MSKFRFVLAAVMATAMTLAFAGMASAAAMNPCGGCHGTTATQDPNPLAADACNNLGRGLHGTHVNYSSFTFKKTVASYGKCSYCHTATTAKAPTLIHINGYVNVTGNASAMAPGLDYNFVTDTCTNACHKKNASTAKWGNYTATVSGGIKLNCDACHDDSTENATTTLSGAHGGHVRNGATISGYSAMNAAANAGCNNCHPDNSGDLWLNGKADDGTKKVYPHASDGTNVVSDNATVSRTGMTVTRGAGSTDTCGAGSCHPRSTPAWNAAMNCDMCHYYNAAPTSAGNTGTGALSYSHNKHFDAGKLCTDCHGAAPVDASHGGAFPIVSDNAAVSRTGMVITRAAGTTDTCTFTSGVGCHGDGSSTPQWGSSGNGCTTCHAYPNSTTNWAAGNGHLVRYAAAVATNSHLRDNATYNKTTDNYSTVCNDTNKCGLCHKGTGVYSTWKANHINGTRNVISTGRGHNACGGDYTITVVTSGSNVTCSNVDCHSGKVTPNWW